MILPIINIYVEKLGPLVKSNYFFVDFIIYFI